MIAENHSNPLNGVLAYASLTANRFYESVGLFGLRMQLIKNCSCPKPQPSSLI